MAIEQRTLRQLRRAFDMTQQELAAKAGVSYYTISLLETGRHQPRHATRLKLAAALGVDATSLFLAAEPSMAARSE